MELAALVVPSFLERAPDGHHLVHQGRRDVVLHAQAQEFLPRVPVELRCLVVGIEHLPRGMIDDHDGLARLLEEDPVELLRPALFRQVADDPDGERLAPDRDQPDV